MLSFSGHIGAKASALVDGQLSTAEEERAWGHVLTCPGCRRLVEHEGWTKRQLGWLDAPGSGSREMDPSPQLLGSLYAVDAWAAVDTIEQRSRRRRTTAAVVGGGAVAASVLGLITFTGSPVSRAEVPSRPSPAMIRGDQVRGPVGSPTGAETNTAPILARRSR
jgi:anti-sigma factor RsiW